MTIKFACLLILPAALSSPLPAQITLQGPATAPVGTSTSWTWSPVSGATAYRVRSGLELNAPWMEGAEATPAPRITDNTGVSYDLIASVPRFEGSRSFHLAIPDFDSEPQSFTIERWVIPTTGWRLQFRNRLRYFAVESALVAEMSRDDGSSWTEVWRRHGDENSDSGTSSTFETAWQAVDIPLPGGTGDGAVKFRFRINPGNRVYDGDTSLHGCYLDAITVTGAPTLEPTTLSPSAPATSHSFTAPAPGTWVLQAASRNAAGTWSAWGAPARLNATPPGGIAAWRTSFFGSSQNSGSAADGHDADGDGLTNLVEYAMGSSPVDSGDRAALEFLPGAGSWEIIYPRHTGRTDVTLTPLVSAELSAWTAPGAPGSPAGFTDTVATPGSVEQRRAVLPGSGPRLFFQLRATIP